MIREFDAESSSHEAASSAKESSLPVGNEAQIFESYVGSDGRISMAHLGKTFS